MGGGRAWYCGELRCVSLHYAAWQVTACYRVLWCVVCYGVVGYRVAQLRVVWVWCGAVWSQCETRLWYS